MKTIVSVFLYVIICSIQIYAVSAEEINLNAKAAVIMAMRTQEKGRKAASKEIQKTDRCDLKIRSGSLRRNDHF